MDAIRDSANPSRTLESFWKGQINSKLWLIENIRPLIKYESTVDIHGGWNGVLASLIFQSDIPVSKIRSIDIDRDCLEIANTMNKLEQIQGKFTAVTSDMCVFKSDADIIINTSFEHISQAQYDLWLSNLPFDSLIVLQSNNYRISEHIRISENLEEFEKQSKIKNILFLEKLNLPLYDRFMIIGKK